jgi:hypothetical protein
MVGNSTHFHIARRGKKNQREHVHKKQRNEEGKIVRITLGKKDLKTQCK